MISAVALLLFLGLIVFGPKKTIEIAQEIGGVLAQVKRDAGEFQESSIDSKANPASGAIIDLCIKNAMV
jgi:Sec-independent protein translocase protein TatA